MRSKLIEPLNLAKVRVQTDCGRHELHLGLLRTHQRLKATSRSGRVDEEACSEFNCLTVARCTYVHAACTERHLRNSCVIHEVGPGSLRLAHKEVVEIGAVPVCVSDRVARARRDEQLISMVCRLSPRFAETVMVKSETAF